MMQFKLLGTGAGPGVPSFFCDCAACREAWRFPACGRTRSGAMLTDGNKNILIDTPPDLRAQLLRENIRGVDGIFFTHWHYDHFGGIGELEYYVKLSRKTPIPVYLPPEAMEPFQRAFPELSEVFDARSWHFESIYTPLPGVSLMPLPANHGVETAGFLLAGAERRLAYFPDTAGLPEISREKVFGVDWLVCDATFYGENWFPESHMAMEESAALGKSVRAKQTVFTHMAMHYSKPVTVARLKREFAADNARAIGYDGMTFNLSNG